MDYNPFSLVGKTILVTGASSGIGRAIAIECSKMGAKVVITARNAERLNDTLLHMDGSGHIVIDADLSSEEGMQQVAISAPLLDGLVHCAGMSSTLPFQFVNKDKIDDLFGINFYAPALLTQKLLKNKKMQRPASIVFISSVSGFLCSAVATSLYSASKGAINGLAKGMALDLAPKGIRVNTVNPGMINTNILSAGTITDEQLAEDAKKYPLKRYGKPEEVAHAVIYLLSDAASWVTGSNLVIDGGLTLQ